jgi:hypothetical protein
MFRFIFFLPLIFCFYSYADNPQYIFSCKTSNNEAIKLYESNDKFIISVNDVKIESQDSAEEIKSTIVKGSPINNDYMEFRANQYYISVGNINTQEESNGHNEKGVLEIGTLSPDRKGEISNKEYKCFSDYKNNIPDIVPE